MYLSRQRLSLFGHCDGGIGAAPKSASQKNSSLASPLQRTAIQHF
jgi:hypothetical protein